ncbi:MAG: FlgD immunoglobulin-like domain containing protein, partial [Candidatus Eisenbacteria bacterium]
TDDGRVWRSVDKGAIWTNISAGLPVRSITRVVADRFDAQVVYVTLSGFGQDEAVAHIYRSNNRGTTWQSIGGNLPDVPANDIVVDGLDPNTLYLGTDLGVFITRNLGATWWGLGAGMPLQTIFNLEYHASSRQLFAFTHGRSIYKLDLGALPVSAPGPRVTPQLALSAPSPNPARGPVRFTLDLDRESTVDVVVHGLDGGRVRTLARDRWRSGRHDLVWDGADDRGRRVAAGVYFVRAVAGGARRTQRIVLTR